MKGINLPVLDHLEHKILLNHVSAYDIYCFFLFTYLVIISLFYDAFSSSFHIYSFQ
jgi:hypothetical protein